MKPISRLGGALAALVLSSYSGVALAASMPEVEPNHPISSAQHLRTSDTEVQITGALAGSDPKGDVDFYLFHAKSGDVITIDVDNGFIGFGVPESVNTALAVFGSGPDYKILRMNDNALVDAGSSSTLDARIEDFVAPRTGSYVVGVTSSPRFFQDGGTTMDSPIIDAGTYLLNITGVSPSVRQIGVEVKPGDNRMTAVNPRSRGKIPVAILGSQNFNALNVDRTSLTFGSTGNETSLHRCNWHGRDVNGDGNVDLVCHFYTQRANFKWTDEEGMLKGVTKDGEAFNGRAWLKLMPVETRSNSRLRR
jgi:hypothetical protein